MLKGKTNYLAGGTGKRLPQRNVKKKIATLLPQTNATGRIGCNAALLSNKKNVFLGIPDRGDIMLRSMFDISGRGEAAGNIDEKENNSTQGTGHLSGGMYCGSTQGEESYLPRSYMNPSLFVNSSKYEGIYRNRRFLVDEEVDDDPNMYA
ncbi:MAG: hypothetical protein ABIE55_00875 [Candidatus Aenigmatarchaeota archaeon]